MSDEPDDYDDDDNWEPSTAPVDKRPVLILQNTDDVLNSVRIGLKCTFDNGMVRIEAPIEEIRITAYQVAVYLQEQP